MKRLSFGSLKPCYSKIHFKVHFWLNISQKFCRVKYKAHIWYPYTYHAFTIQRVLKNTWLLLCFPDEEPQLEKSNICLYRLGNEGFPDSIPRRLPEEGSWLETSNSYIDSGSERSLTFLFAKHSVALCFFFVTNSTPHCLIFIQTLPLRKLGNKITLYIQIKFHLPIIICIVYLVK